VLSSFGATQKQNFPFKKRLSLFDLQSQTLLWSLQLVWVFYFLQQDDFSASLNLLDDSESFFGARYFGSDCKTGESSSTPVCKASFGFLPMPSTSRRYVTKFLTTPQCPSFLRVCGLPSELCSTNRHPLSLVISTSPESPSRSLVSISHVLTRGPGEEPCKDNNLVNSIKQLSNIYYAMVLL
jgi:hypothetical protein